MLQEREKAILKTLITQAQMITTEYVALLLHVSSRTIKTDIKRINQQLENEHIQIKTIRGKGISLDYDEEKKGYLHELIGLDGDSNPKSGVFERKYKIIQYLLNQTNYVTIAEICDALYFSRSAITNELTTVEEELAKHKLVLLRNNLGIFVSGNEIDIRTTLVTIEIRLKSFAHFGSLQEIPSYQEISIDGLYQLLIDYENNFNITITDNEFRKLFIYLCISIYRLRKYVDRRKILQEAPHDCNLLKQSKYLMERICRQFDLEYRKEEIIYLFRFLSGLSLGAENIQHSSIAHNEVQQILRTVLEEVDEVYFTNFRHNERLYKNLFLHLIPAINRSIYRIQIENPLLQELKRSFAFSFEVSLLIANKLEERLNIQLSDKEIGLFTMHIIVAMESKVNQNEQTKVLIVCPSGKGMAEFLKVKIHSEFTNINVVEVITSSRQLAQVGEGAIDLIITTTPIEESSIPVLYVSPVLKQHDIDKINEYLSQKERAKKEKLKLLFGYFQDDVALFSQSFQNKEPALKYLCEKMAFYDFGASDMYDSVIKREAVSGTEIGNFIAIPHPYPEAVKKNGIGILITKKPFVWDQEKVQILLLLCIKPDKNREFEHIMESIYEISQLPFLVSRLKEVKTLLEFKEVIQEGIGYKFH